MLRFLADENFKGGIVRGLLLRRPDLDIVRAQDEQLSGMDDFALLAWAAARHRIVLTHDRATMPEIAYQRLARCQEMAGVFLVGNRVPIGQAIDEILSLADHTEHAEWAGRVAFLPLPRLRP